MRGAPLLLLAMLVALPLAAAADDIHAFASERKGATWTETANGITISCKGIVAGTVAEGRLSFAFDNEPLVPPPGSLVYHACAWYTFPNAVTAVDFPVERTAEGYSGARAAPLSCGVESIEMGSLPGPSTFTYELERCDGSRVEVRGTVG